MVMVTRSAHRKADSSGDSNSCDVSQRNVPPWCSSGKVCVGKRLRKVASPTWEIRSSYPLRENIWEYLHDDKNFGYKRKQKKSFCKQKPARNNRWRKTVILLAFLLIALGVTTFRWMSDTNSEANLITKVISRTKLMSSLMGLEHASVDEECCYRMKHLAAALLRAEEVLRSTLRVRKTMMLTAQTIKLDAHNSIERVYIDGATVSKGSGTKEWGGRVALWGVVPLWRAAPPPDTVLALRKPAPSDCWPFRGSYGELIIDLPSKLAVRAVSIEHIRPDTARSAPKHFVLYGILENSTRIEAVDSEYRYKGPKKQYYLLLTRNIPLRRLVFRVLSNQGNPQYTCVYRVHLYEGGSVSSINALNKPL